MKHYTKNALPHILSFILGILLLHSLWGLNLYSALFYIGIFFIIFALLEWIRISLPPGKARKLISNIFILDTLLVLIVAIIHADNIRNYGPFLAETVRAVFQTNTSELIAYSFKFISPDVLAWFAVSCTIWIGTYWLLLKVDTFLIKRRHIIPLFLSFFCVGTSFMYLGRGEAILFLQEAQAYKEILSDYSPSRSSLRKLDWFNNIKSDFSGNIVVVIGESTSRHHMGLYNYFRNTTPNLNSIENQLVIFKDAISTHSHTSESLSDALTFNRRDKHTRITQVADLISLSKQAGFYTAWLSNQNAVGLWDNYTSAIASEADYIKYHDPAGGRSLTRTIYDHEMLNTLDLVLKRKQNKKKLVFLHMMSTHFPYCGIIPEEFEHPNGKIFDIPIDLRFFGPLFNKHAGRNNLSSVIDGYVQSVNCYDSAINYVDFVLNKVIQRLNNETEPTVLVYFSDHGEAPTLGTGHESRLHSHFHVEVPLLVWANKAYLDKYPRKISTMQSNREKPFSLVDLSYSIADLAGIDDIPELRSRSFLSEQYVPFSRKTIFGTKGYDTYQSESDYAERSRANLLSLNKENTTLINKVWAHRVDSMGSLLESKDIFSGVELDVVFSDEKRRFFIYHPPAANVGLSLEQYLIQDNGKLHYWFDWKNATDANIKNAILRLNVLNDKYSLKQRVIIETSFPNIYSESISMEGWISSYYLPTKEILSAMNDDVEGLSRIAKEIKTIVTTHKYNAISFDWRLLPFFDKYLKQFAVSNDLGIFTWNQYLRIDQEDAPRRIKDILEQHKIDVLLVNFPSPFDL